jgi:TolB-like protein
VVLNGITEELTDSLAKVENLRVVSRTSAFQYKGRTEHVRKIGSELNVGALLEGNVRKTEGTLRITVHLTRTKDGCHIWSQSYECSVQDVFDVQDEITAGIVNSLSAKLGWNVSHAPGPRLILSKPTLTKDLVAYDLYLQGLYFWNRRDVHGIRKSIAYFQQAIARDDEYAMAHAALAEAYMTLASIEEEPAQRAAARAAAQTELNSYLSLVQQNYEQKRSG